MESKGSVLSFQNNLSYLMIVLQELDRKDIKGKVPINKFYLIFKKTKKYHFVCVTRLVRSAESFRFCSVKTQQAVDL